VIHWLLRSILAALAMVLSLQIYPLTLHPLDLKGLALGLGLTAVGAALEILGRRLEIRALAGSVLGLACGAGVGALVWRLVPPGGLPGISAEFLREAALLVCLYAGAALGARKAEHFTLESLRSRGPHSALSSTNKILDTSVIIDGRIADICETGFMEGQLVVPPFVLNELQYIADSPDPLKRNRGRKGLDILQRIQKGVHVRVVISEVDFPEIREVDLKLIELARQTSSKILTNDFNLNKVAQLRGVEVLNINELANSLKPVILPGESMKIFILKEGKEPNQGVGYLDDGTMVVVDNAKRLIGKTVDIVITSVLQTTAGKMFFGRFDAPPSAPHGAAPAEEVDRLRRNV